MVAERKRPALLLVLDLATAQHWLTVYDPLFSALRWTFVKAPRGREGGGGVGAGEGANKTAVKVHSKMVPSAENNSKTIELLHGFNRLERRKSQDVGGEADPSHAAKREPTS